MTIKAFIAPMVGTGTRADPRRAKWQSGDPSILRGGQIRFGRTEDCILLIETADTPQGDAYMAQIDADSECTPVADATNINDALTAPQVTAIQGFLEARGVPADWLNAGETRRQALRGVAGMFLFSQRMEGRFGTSWKQKLVEHGVSLASEWQNLPAQFQTELVEAAQSFGWMDVTLASVAPTTTLRQILRAMGNRFQTMPMYIANFQL